MVASFEETYVDLVTTWNELQTGENTNPLAAVGFSLTSLGFGRVCWQYQLISFSFRPFTFNTVYVHFPCQWCDCGGAANQSINFNEG